MILENEKKQAHQLFIVLSEQIIPQHSSLPVHKNNPQYILHSTISRKSIIATGEYEDRAVTV